MTSIWKKIRKSQIKDNDCNVKSPTETNGNSCQVTATGPLFIITQLDEDEYFKKINNGSSNPISIRSQIVQKLDDILVHKQDYVQFTQFLESQNRQFYFLFVQECEKYEYILNQLNICKQKELSEEAQNELQSGNILPDLVSNIPKNAIASPMPSPEKQLTCEESNSYISEADRRNYELNQFLWNSDSLATTENSVKSNLVLDNERSPELIALNIYKNFIESSCNNPITIHSNVQDELLVNLKDRKFTLDLFSQAKAEVYLILNQLFVTFLNSEYYLKHKVDILTSSNVKLQDVINCDNTFPYLMEFMEQEGAKLLLEFWISISNFRQLYPSASKDTYDIAQAQEDAMILYDKFFSMQATSPLGFSHAIRFMVESSICQEKGLNPQCFDVPLGIVLFVIERDFFSQYVSSAFHIKCITELINSAQTNPKRHKRTGSESTCSSDQLSVSTAPTKCMNTLLAMDSSNNNLKSLEDNLTMRIDSLQILDPDSLWRRKNYTRLSCGYVDRLGRFESELTPTPFKQESRLSKLKKLMNFEENKLKEEMAYQVAEMIIKDVTNVTLNESTYH